MGYEHALSWRAHRHTLHGTQAHRAHGPLNARHTHAHKCTRPHAHMDEHKRTRRPAGASHSEQRRRRRSRPQCIRAPTVPRPGRASTSAHMRSTVGTHWLWSGECVGALTHAYTNTRAHMHTLTQANTHAVCVRVARVHSQVCAHTVSGAVARHLEVIVQVANDGVLGVVWR